MLRFAHIEFLWGLLLIPVFLLVFLILRYWKKKALRRLGDKETVARIIPEVSFSRPAVKFAFFSLAFASLTIALADPQVGTKIEEAKRSGSDLMILLDVSNSMLAADLAPNRLENAKRAVSQLIDNLHNDRIGIVIFAGEAYMQLPVTTDHSAAKLFLDNINTNIVPTQGTAIGAAIDMGIKSFDLVNGTSKAMILMTDGENHEDDAVRAAGVASKKGITIHVVGLGSAEGAPVPIYKNGAQAGFHTDEQGHTVVSKLNEEMCKEVAKAGNGVYVRASNANSGLGLIMDQIEKMQKKTYDSKSFKNYEDRFQFFLGLAFIFLIIEFFISSRKNVKLSGLKLFEVKK
ncbi:vWA domain-containing protein [Pedobacter nutrimenti]|jgi:Ca-activated chloride channel family protein|uniref:Ca-activated chloride channel family protein n=1 Tax=Pedobacter nutrimenti TaxID=1241337 RepID=A0A318U9H7_9SPHI|nr:VWA domain-containing protein [Pedobacter nutrimenti]PYF68989.1 Ca-activated chloride channel family protein [Pedobacter nutrimenti]